MRALLAGVAGFVVGWLANFAMALYGSKFQPPGRLPPAEDPFDVLPTDELWADELWAGDGSEEPPSVVTSVRESDGGWVMTRNTNGRWRWAQSGDGRTLTHDNDEPWSRMADPGLGPYTETLSG